VTAAVCAFPDLESAINTTIMLIQTGVPVARVELLDDVMMQATINHTGLEGYEPKNTLFFEFHGTDASVREQVETAESIAGEFGGSAFRWAERQEDRNALWEARHVAHYAIKAMRPNSEVMAGDVCVPISRLAECILESKRDLDESGLVGAIVGHVGDGNFHLGYVIDPSDPEMIERCLAHNERMVMRAIAMEGTCTGEYGVGRGKMKYLRPEHGDAVDYMVMIKKALDPKGIMNPGKILPV
jgi:D-lactate dehydrogenase (cytochrome)